MDWNHADVLIHDNSNKHFVSKILTFFCSNLAKSQNARL